MRRRTYLIGGITLLTSIAGCGSPGPGANETTDGDVGNGVSPTDTEDGIVGDTPTDTEGGMLNETDDGGIGGTEASPTETDIGGGNETDQSPTETGGSPGAEGQSVDMVTEEDSFYFDPIGLHVEPGTTVEWVNASGSHSSTAYEDRIPEDAEAWDSGTLTEEDATFSHTFETEGTYDYYCTPHQTQGMVARIVVGEPGGPAEGDMPPDGDVPESQTIVDQGSVGYDEFTSE